VHSQSVAAAPLFTQRALFLHLFLTSAIFRNDVFHISLFKAMAGGQGPACEGIETMPEARGVESGGALQPNTGQQGYYFSHNDVPLYVSPDGKTAPPLARGEKTVFCLTTREACFVLVILILVIAGSVGGGVGGVIAAKHQSQNKSPLEALSSSQTISVASTNIETSNSSPTPLVPETSKYHTPTRFIPEIPSILRLWHNCMPVLQMPIYISSRSKRKFQCRTQKNALSQFSLDHL